MEDKKLTLNSFTQDNKGLSFREKTTMFSKVMARNEKQNFYLREILSPAANRVYIYDRIAKEKREMLMFGSNNYLGLADHPRLLEKISARIKNFGVGLGGPPLLNGYTSLHKELEERLSAFKKKEATMLFTSGFGTNLGLVSAMADQKDVIVHDELAHASLIDGLKLGTANTIQFDHNQVKALDRVLQSCSQYNNKFVVIEGVYSMDGDTAPLTSLVPVARKHNALIMLDDAHGTGVLGENGRGTCNHYGVTSEVDIIMGTFSKSFASSGGFVSSDREIIEYLRFYTRPYVFSASPTPMNVAAVLSALDLMEEEPWRVRQLLENVQYAVSRLKPFVQFAAPPESAIITVRVPGGVNIRKLAFEFHSRGIFINSVEHPVVPPEGQRFRISMMATHTREDIDTLAAIFHAIWTENDLVEEARKVS